MLFRSKGVGLGLSISKSIVELLSGEIAVESKINKGTTFYVKVPLEEIVKESISKQETEINFKGKRILIIDELPSVYSLLGIYLNSLYIDTISENNENDAIKIYNKQKDKIDIIIIGLNLPDIDSLNLATKLKQINKKCIIISTGKKNTNTNLIDYNLNRPINKDKLLSILIET